MTSVCEEKYKGLQKGEKQLRRFSIQEDTYFRRDAKQDINMFMTYIRRQLRDNKLENEDYSSLTLYVASQRNYFKSLKPIKDVTCADSELPGKTNYNEPAIYNGLQWVLLCFEAAMGFDDKTPALTLLGYF